MVAETDEGRTEIVIVAARLALLLRLTLLRGSGLVLPGRPLVLRAILRGAILRRTLLRLPVLLPTVAVAFARILVASATATFAARLVRRCFRCLCAFEFGRRFARLDRLHRSDMLMARLGFA